MIVVIPEPVTGSNLISSNIPEPDTGESAWTAGTYALGTKKINTTTHRIYQVVADPSTADDPLVGITKTPPTWVDIGPTNRWAMFDEVVGTQSTETGSIVVEETFLDVVNAIAGINIEGAESVNVQVRTAGDDLVYDTDVPMVNNSYVVDWYRYYFAPIIRRSEFLLTDLPAYLNAKIKTTISGLADVSIGALVAGRQVDLGVALYGSSWQAIDFSRKERDEFGNFTIVRRRTADLFDYDVSVNKPLFPYVKDILKSLSTTPCVWIGSPGQDDGTTVYGYYKNVQINISSPSILKCTIQVEGLV